MRKVLFVLASIVFFISCGKDKANTPEQALDAFMIGRMEHNPEKIIKFFSEKDSTNTHVSSFYLDKDEQYKIQSIKSTDETRGKGTIEFIVRQSRDSFKTEFWYSLKEVDGEWICVSHSAIGIDDADEFYK